MVEYNMNELVWRVIFNRANGEVILDTAQALNAFLAGSEKRAFRIAFIATQSNEDALDLVQDAMLILAKRYVKRDASEWPPLFHRILQNKIRDWYRRQSVKHKLFSWFQGDDGEKIEDNVANTQILEPEREWQNENLAQALEQAIGKLPLRQQQTFLLRSWEGLNVNETATAMGISGGSVKTHYARAVAALKESLGAFYDEG
jgi:RNA polymerase sigma-70 factor (ECF subfamily)